MSRLQHESSPALYNLDAERTLLGALLLDPEKLNEVSPLLSEEDFYDSVNRTIFAAVVRLHDERAGVDPVTTAEALRGDAKFEQVGGLQYLVRLTSDVPTSSLAVRYAQIIQEHARKRRLAHTAATLAERVKQNSHSVEELVEFAEQQLLEHSRGGTTTQAARLSQLADERYEYYSSVYEAEDKAALYGLTTGFVELDDLLTGLSPGHLMVLAGRPSMGKTALALDFAKQVAARGKSVAIFSLEMTKEQLADRLFAGALGVPTYSLRKGMIPESDFQRMGTAFDAIKGHPIFIDDDPDTSLANLRSKARRQQMQHGLDLLLIDYLQLIEVTDRAAGENQTQRISHISKSLKTLARELQCPVIALSQLSRSCEQRSPHIPILSDLRDSGSIEQDADTVLMLYREGYYNPDCENPDLTDIFVRKNRQGPTGVVSLDFDKQRMTFRERPRQKGQ